MSGIPGCPYPFSPRRWIVGHPTATCQNSNLLNSVLPRVRGSATWILPQKDHNIYFRDYFHRSVIALFIRRLIDPGFFSFYSISTRNSIEKSLLRFTIDVSILIFRRVLLYISFSFIRAGMRMRRKKRRGGRIRSSRRKDASREEKERRWKKREREKEKKAKRREIVDERKNSISLSLSLSLRVAVVPKSVVVPTFETVGNCRCTVSLVI